MMENSSCPNTGISEQDTTAVHRTDIEKVLLPRREALLEELRELDKTLSQLHQEYSARLHDLQTRRKPAEEALHHIEALLLFEGYTDNDQSGRDITGEKDVVVAAASVTDAVFHLLEELHQPLHYKDIVLRLQGRGVYVPGRDPAATLLSRINRDSRFKRTSIRGVYGLSTWRLRSAKPRRTNRQRAKK